MVIDDNWIENNTGLIWSAVNSYRKGDEDLFQVAIIGAIEASQKFDDNHDASFVTYIFNGMKLAISNELRKSTAIRRNGHMTKCELDDYAMLFDIETIEEELHSDLWVEHILSNISLTEKEKHALKYHVLLGLSYREASNIMGISRVRVHQLCTRAIEKVRKQYERESF